MDNIVWGWVNRCVLLIWHRRSGCLNYDDRVPKTNTTDSTRNDVVSTIARRDHTNVSDVFHSSGEP